MLDNNEGFKSVSKLVNHLVCSSYGTFETSTNFPNCGVANICLDLIGQKAFFLTLLDKCSSMGQVFTMKLIQVS